MYISTGMNHQADRSLEAAVPLDRQVFDAILVPRAVVGERFFKWGFPSHGGIPKGMVYSEISQANMDYNWRYHPFQETSTS